MRVWQVPFLTHFIHCNDFSNIEFIMYTFFSSFEDLRGQSFRFLSSEFEKRKINCASSQYDRIKISNSESFAISELKIFFTFLFFLLNWNQIFGALFHVWKTPKKFRHILFPRTALSILILLIDYTMLGMAQKDERISSDFYWYKLFPNHKTFVETEHRFDQPSIMSLFSVFFFFLSFSISHFYSFQIESWLSDKICVTNCSTAHDNLMNVCSEFFAFGFQFRWFN